MEVGDDGAFGDDGGLTGATGSSVGLSVGRFVGTRNGFLVGVYTGLFVGVLAGDFVGDDGLPPRHPDVSPLFNLTMVV